LWCTHHIISTYYRILGHFTHDHTHWILFTCSSLHVHPHITPQTFYLFVHTDSHIGSGVLFGPVFHMPHPTTIPQLNGWYQIPRTPQHVLYHTLFYCSPICCARFFVVRVGDCRTLRMIPLYTFPIFVVVGDPPTHPTKTTWVFPRPMNCGGLHSGSHSMERSLPPHTVPDGPHPPRTVHSLQCRFTFTPQQCSCRSPITFTPHVYTVLTTDMDYVIYVLQHRSGYGGMRFPTFIHGFTHGRFVMGYPHTFVVPGLFHTHTAGWSWFRPLVDFNSLHVAVLRLRFTVPTVVGHFNRYADGCSCVTVLPFYVTLLRY